MLHRRLKLERKSLSKKVDKKIIRDFSAPFFFLSISEQLLSTLTNIIGNSFFSLSKEKKGQKHLKVSKRIVEISFVYVILLENE